MTIEELRTFMIQWNNKFPIDRWWRKKHNISFLSLEHRECSFIAQLLEYQEDVLFAEASKEEKQDDPYIPNMGEWLKRNASDEIDEYDVEQFRAEAAEMAKFEEMTEEENNG